MFRKIFLTLLLKPCPCPIFDGAELRQFSKYNIFLEAQVWTKKGLLPMAILLTKMCYCFWLYGNFFQRIDKVSDEGEFTLAKFSSSCQLSDDTQLVKKRLFEESFSENLLKLQVSMLSDLKQTCLFSLIFSKIPIWTRVTKSLRNKR